MKKLKVAGIALIALGVIIGLGLFLIGWLGAKPAGIYITTTPPASIYLDDRYVGRTPYKDTSKPGEKVVKLVPDSFEKPLVPYETKVELVSGIETVIKREFGESEETSTGEIVSFEKAPKGETSLAIVSIPDSAQILIDGTNRAFTPYKTSGLTPGEHQIVISSNGYLDRSVKVKTYSGHKLTAVIQLAQAGEVLQAKEDPQEEEKKEEKKVEERKPQVEIKETPVGFLRVRAEPSTLGEEVGRVKPGERYEIVTTDERTGWFEIEYEEGKEGWMSNQYAKKIESASPSATLKPTKTPTPTP